MVVWSWRLYGQQTPGVDVQGLGQQAGVFLANGALAVLHFGNVAAPAPGSLEEFGQSPRTGPPASMRARALRQCASLSSPSSRFICSISENAGLSGN